MVSYLRHYAVAFIIFALMATLYVNIYSGVETAYNLTQNDLDDNGTNVMQRIENINLIQQMDLLSDALYTILNPQNAFDLIGAMYLVGWGVIKLIASIALFPIEILGVMTDFYYIPPIVVTVLVLMSTLYVGFILLSAWMKEKI